MNEISERRAFARAAAMAAGLAVFDGGAAALIYWLAGGETPLYFGGLAAAIAAGCAAASLALMWGAFREDDHPTFEPTGLFLVARIIIGILLGTIVLLPPVILTGGYLARWLLGRDEGV